MLASKASTVGLEIPRRRVSLFAAALRDQSGPEAQERMIVRFVEITGPSLQNLAVKARQRAPELSASDPRPPADSARNPSAMRSPKLLSLGIQQSLDLLLEVSDVFFGVVVGGYRFGCANGSSLYSVEVSTPPMA